MTGQNVKRQKLHEKHFVFDFTRLVKQEDDNQGSLDFSEG